MREISEQTFKIFLKDLNMKTLKKDVQKNESALVSIVYEFLDEVANFESDEYVINATVTHDVTFKVKANSYEEAEDADFYFSDCDDEYQTDYVVNSVEKIDANARNFVEYTKVKNFVAKFEASLSQEINDEFDDTADQVTFDDEDDVANEIA